MTQKGHFTVRRLDTICFGVCLAVALAMSANVLLAQAPSATPAASFVQKLFGSDDAEDIQPPKKSQKTPAQAPAPLPQAAAQGDAELAPDQKIEMTPEGNFDLSVQGADVRLVLRQLSRQARKNIIVSKGVVGVVNVDLFGVTMKEALGAILKANDLVSVEEGSFIYIYTSAEYADFRKLDYRVFRLFYIKAGDARKLLRDVLSADGKISTTPPPEEGILEAPADTKDWGGAQDHASDAILVIYDYEENLDKAAAILKEVDIRPDQVLIEATILSANLNETNALGIDLQLLAGVDFQTFGTTSDLTGITVPAPPIGGVKNFNQAQARLVTPFTNNFPTGSSPMTVGFINNNVGVFLRALEGITDTTVLANPKLLIVNKQRGDVLVGNKDGYITTTVSQTVATETVEFLETGTKLRVRPFIGKDGYIRMELHPEISRGQVAQVNETGPALPSKQTTEVTLNVIVRDGKTIVIAGLFRDQVIVQRNQTPVLGNIPLFGQLFRSTVDSTIREEVIILLTPHIIRQPQDELVGERVRDDIERTRAGVRKGLQWFSRSRLADSYTRWARQAATNGDVSKAMWNVDIALSLEPKMIEAIRLKERLSRKAYWADQPAFMSTRNIIKRMIMEDLEEPFEKVTYPFKPLDANKQTPAVRKRLGIENRKILPLNWPGPPKARLDTPTPKAKPKAKVKARPAPKPKPLIEAKPAAKAKPVKKQAPAVKKPAAKKPAIKKPAPPTQVKPARQSQKPKPIKVKGWVEPLPLSEAAGVATVN